jgi:DNA topoisomerase-1
VVEFPGFLKLYEEGRDEPAAEMGEDARRLPRVEPDAPLERGAVKSEQHFTEPPPRYSEASLVRRLEELGIGRPSTYASILSVLQERSYVRLEKNRFQPEDKGRLVTAFLESYFRRYVEYGFTADMEQQLDEVSAGNADWRQVLRAFWADFQKAVGETAELRVREVLDAVNELLAPHLYPDKGQARACPRCGEGRLSLKGGRYGFFLGCSNYPECRFTRPLVAGNGEEAAGEGELDGPQELGLDPESGLAVSLRKGPFGLYLQLGDAGEDGKPRRASLPKDVSQEVLDLELALKLLSLPRGLGVHPETGLPIETGIGRYGPFLRMDGKYVRLASTDEVLNLGLNRAVALLAEAADKGGRRRGGTELRQLGKHPEDGAPVTLLEGRYGPYVKHGNVNATLPRGTAPDGLTLEEAVRLIAERAAKGPATRRGGRRAAGLAKTATAKPKAAKSKKPKRKTAARPKRPAAGHAEADSG